MRNRSTGRVANFEVENHGASRGSPRCGKVEPGARIRAAWNRSSTFRSGCRLPEAAIRREPGREVFKHIFKIMEQHVLCECFVPSLRRSLNYDDFPLESILSRRFFQKCFSPFVKSTLAIAPFFQARRELAGCSERSRDQEPIGRGSLNPVARLRWAL